MSDRPDWLPEPPPVPVAPLGERLHFAAAGVASLFLFVVGVSLLLLGVVSVVQTTTLHSFGILVVTRNLIPGVICLTVAYLMRWCLRRAKQGLNKA